MKQRFAILILAGFASACATRGEPPKQMDVIAPKHLPEELFAAVKAPVPVPAEVDEAGRPVVPEAPQMPQTYYTAAEGIDALDPIVITDNRAPRGSVAAEAIKAAVIRESNAPQAPQVVATAAPRPAVVPPAPQTQTTAQAQPQQLQPVSIEEVPAPPVQRHAAAAGGYGIHLASYRQAAKARDGWQIYASQFGDLLAPLSPRGAPVSIPEKGDFVRLLAGPFSDRDAAQSVCDTLEYRDQYCRVMRYEGAPLL